jgi:hypothetical protein
MHIDSPVNSPYIGDWMASAYTIGGRRVDLKLSLNAGGTFERWAWWQEPKRERIDRGRWHHEDGEDVMRLESDTPDDHDRISSLWWVLEIKGLEGANTIMVLRWCALASRNLPILFYRVHLQPTGPPRTIPDLIN